MKMAMVAAGFTAGEADQLRRAMAAWRHAGSIEKFQQKMIDGMLANGYERDFAERCFNQIKGFGEYGFPESHAAIISRCCLSTLQPRGSNGIVPAAFCCALLNSQPMGFYAPAQIVRDAREHGVEVRAIEVNRSDWDCTLESAVDSPASVRTADKRTWGIGGPAVRLGFRMIKGQQAAHAHQIVERRIQHGSGVSLNRRFPCGN